MKKAACPKTDAELQKGLALGKVLAGLRVVAGRTAVFQVLPLGPILLGLEKVLGWLYKDVFIHNSPAHAKVLPSHSFRLLFPTEWKEGGTCDTVTG